MLAYSTVRATVTILILSRFRFGECIARAIGSLGIAAPTAHRVHAPGIVQGKWADLAVTFVSAIP